MTKRQRASKPSFSKQNLRFEALESREMMNGDIEPILMVVADQQDFYYQEYSDTRAAIESEGLDVVVAATTTNPTLPHANSGQGAGTGEVNPDIALSAVNPDDYSGIVFIGGWGSSMYQFDVPGTYSNPNYNGDPATREIVNDLINDFMQDDKQVAAICHAVMVLAWGRVNGASTLEGRQISIPYVGSPAVTYDGVFYADGVLSQWQQAIDNGALPNAVSGAYGDPTTTTDDVVISDNVITAENWDSAAYFGEVVAQEVIAANANQTPTIADDVFQIEENSANGSFVGSANGSDPDAGQTLTYQILGGNDGGAFAIDANTGELTVANSAALNFEATPIFNLIVEVADDGLPVLTDTAVISVELTNVVEPGPSWTFADSFVTPGWQDLDDPVGPGSLTSNSQTRSDDGETRDNEFQAPATDHLASKSGDQACIASPERTEDPVPAGCQEVDWFFSELGRR